MREHGTESLRTWEPGALPSGWKKGKDIRVMFVRATVHNNLFKSHVCLMNGRTHRNKHTKASFQGEVKAQDEQRRE